MVDVATLRGNREFYVGAQTRRGVGHVLFPR